MILQGAGLRQTPSEAAQEEGTEMSLDIRGFSGNTKVNATMLDQQQDISQMTTVKKNWFTHTLFFKIITLGIGYAIVKSQDEKAEAAAERVKKSAITLLQNLDQLANDKAKAQQDQTALTNVQARDVVMSGDETVNVSLNTNGKVCVRMKDGDEVHELNSTVEELRWKLADDVFTHANLFTKEQLRDALPKKPDSQERTLDQLSTEDTFRRRIYEKVIKGFSGVAADELQNVTTDNLRQLAEELLSEEKMTEATVKDRVTEFNKTISADNVNSLEAQSLVTAYREQVKSGAANGKVIIEKPEPKPNAPKPEAANAKAMRELCADLIYNEDIDQDTEVEKSPSMRLQMVLRKHVDTLVILSNINDLKSLGLEDDILEMLDALKGQLSSLGTDKDTITRSLNPENTFKGKIWQTTLSLALKGADDVIIKQIGGKMKGLQDEFNTKVDKVFKSDNSGIDIKDSKSLENQSIKKLFDNASSPDEGYGRFMKNVLKRYFADASPIDKRSMAAAGIRYGYGATSEGAKLGAMLKGAGPLMQKMLQGLDVGQVGQDFSPVIKDMKKNLAPIPEEVVKANMLDIVNRAGGKISNITVVKSLGRASVGEAFHCKLTGPAYPNGKDIVVKILRPDALQKLKREEQLFSEEAKKVDGMENTFKEQLAGIKRELDFTLEDANIQVGELYDHGYARVKSVKTLPVVLSSPGCLVMEMAPGKTVDGYLEDLAKEVDEVMAPTQNRNSDKFNVDTVTTAVNVLTQKYQEIARRQKDLCDLASKWVTEGLYGKGFFHGDLHAGNIMVADEGLTVIDFGNVTQLSDQQKADITAMMAAAGVANGADTANDQAVGSFVNHFRNMLSADGQTQLDTKRSAVENMLKVVLAKGNRSDTGSRIFVAINYIQRMGVEVTGAVFKFTQSQIRLQNTIEAMNKQMADIKEKLNNLAGLPAGALQLRLTSDGNELEEHLRQGHFTDVETFFNRFVVDNDDLKNQLKLFKDSNQLKAVKSELDALFPGSFQLKTFCKDVGSTQAFIKSKLNEYAGDGGLVFDEKNKAFVVTEKSSLWTYFGEHWSDLPSEINVSAGGSLKVLFESCEEYKQKIGVQAEQANPENPPNKVTQDFFKKVETTWKLVEMLQKLDTPPQQGTPNAAELAAAMKESAHQKVTELARLVKADTTTRITNAKAPDDFCDRMSTVILQNLKTSCSRVDTNVMKLIV